MELAGISNWNRGYCLRIAICGAALVVLVLTGSCTSHRSSTEQLGAISDCGGERPISTTDLTGEYCCELDPRTRWLILLGEDGSFEFRHCACVGMEVWARGDFILEDPVLRLLPEGDDRNEFSAFSRYLIRDKGQDLVMLDEASNDLERWIFVRVKQGSCSPPQVK